MNIGIDIVELPGQRCALSETRGCTVMTITAMLMVLKTMTLCQT